jgi:hypothetical protein
MPWLLPPSMTPMAIHPPQQISFPDVPAAIDLPTLRCVDE